jgi:hypothetical protein
MVNYYTLDTLGPILNTDLKEINEIIATHENGQNLYQNDQTSAFSNYVKYDSFSLENVTKYRLYFANTVGLEENEDEVN